MNPYTLLLIFGAVFAVLFLLERLLPLRRRTCSILGRLVVNLALAAVAFGASMVTVRPFLHARSPAADPPAPRKRAPGRALPGGAFDHTIGA